MAGLKLQGQLDDAAFSAEQGGLVIDEKLQPPLSPFGQCLTCLRANLLAQSICRPVRPQGDGDQGHQRYHQQQQCQLRSNAHSWSVLPKHCKSELNYSQS